MDAEDVCAGFDTVIDWMVSRLFLGAICDVEDRLSLRGWGEFNLSVDSSRS